MSCNLPLVRHRVLSFLLIYGRRWSKLEINIPLQQIYAISKGGLIIEGGVMSSAYANCICEVHSDSGIIN